MPIAASDGEFSIRGTPVATPTNARISKQTVSDAVTQKSLEVVFPDESEDYYYIILSRGAGSGRGVCTCRRVRPRRVRSVRFLLLRRRDRLMMIIIIIITQHVARRWRCSIRVCGSFSRRYGGVATRRAVLCSRCDESDGGPVPLSIYQRCPRRAARRGGPLSLSTAAAALLLYRYYYQYYEYYTRRS